MTKKHLVVLSGAGMSAESGIPTFRGAGGLWEGYRIEEVATPGAWERDFRLVLDFYNERRRAVLGATPNRGHLLLAELEAEYQVSIITQNIDDLHERAGSSSVLHLHGEILKSRSTQDPQRVYPIAGTELKEGDCCALGSQLRPHIVWFGEEVPLMDDAARLCHQADLFVVIGTSLQVYPAAGLLYAVAPSVPKFLIDPGNPPVEGIQNLEQIPEGGGRGMEVLRERLGVRVKE